MKLINRSGVVCLVGLWCVVVAPVLGQTVEWPSYAADVAGTKYSPLEQINHQTVGDLEIAWRQPVIPEAIRDGSTVRGPVAAQNTPLMAGGLLYVSTGLGTVAALDPSTGDVVWNDDVPVFEGNDRNRRARQTRGVANWTDGEDARVLAARGPKLVALNAQTGERYPEFGTDGEVDLRDGLI
ncbi:MAG: PQQ-binding-like beta-propeller repeat protein, partial [Planctomycetaceae bacterium]